MRQLRTLRWRRTNPRVSTQNGSLLLLLTPFPFKRFGSAFSKRRASLWLQFLSELLSRVWRWNISDWLMYSVPHCLYF